ncbi:hypothetical protein LF41_2431 [Lysobacter dokdonensis DS-58]|uniref:Uncharacterized protein n=1 Tax=Lysobacter dokdonensis DS-58 TaxID=1300345 RepID=A0A0A2X3T6_9GAMM|nr:hypothetical protein [Lysobacter dokdonensis]KGQ19924.1 hypothetical protein LF41_2431 [Lysobacter dokdonensis DS-58]
MKWVLVAVVLVGAFLAYGSHLANTPEGKQRIAERRAIDRCREQQDDALQELATRRLIRVACDNMVADYRAKWNREP